MSWTSPSAPSPGAVRSIEVTSLVETKPLAVAGTGFAVNDTVSVEATVGLKAVRASMGALYSVPYFFLATHWWQWALLPLQWVMGPIHGAIVNWCGHKYGYRSFDNGDQSRNTLPFDMVTMGELFQNNHHKYPMSPNFAARRFEIDPTWQVMRVLARLRVIEIATPQRAVYPQLREAAA